jgi:hypothetical protein
LPAVAIQIDEAETSNLLAQWGIMARLLFDPASSSPACRGKLHSSQEQPQLTST